MEVAMMWLAIVWLATFAAFIEVVNCAEEEPPWFGED
jgi:hypothetical protein